MTVEAILEATARVLAEDGFDRASTNRIARVAGVSPGSLYQYFPNKDSLVVALLERHVETTMRDGFAELRRAASLPLGGAVRVLVDFMLAAHGREPELHRVLMDEVPRSRAGERVRVLEAELHRILTTTLESRRSEIRPRDPELAAFVVWSVVESLCHRAVLYEPERLSDGRLAEEISAVVVGYLDGGAEASQVRGARRPGT